jgi:foldase protein PrsA
MENTTSGLNSAPIPQAPEPGASTTSKPKFTMPGFVNKRNVIILLIIIALVGLGWWLKSVLIAATVDGRPISRWSVVKVLEKQSGKEVLDNLISEKLIQIEGNKQNIEISDQEVKDQVKKIEDQLTQQGGKLEEVLAAQGLTMEELNRQLVLQKTAEKILGDKLNVTDEEIASYINENQIPPEEGQEEEQKNQIREQLKQQKFSSEIGKWLDDRKSNAKIKEFVNY